MPSLAAAVSSALILIVILFQLALAFGAPWGHLAMGGRFPGKLPTKLRVAEVVQSLVMIFLGAIILIRDGFFLLEYRQASTLAIWFVVAIFALSLVMNLATPSKWERAIWSPVVAGILVCSIVVASS